ncbi:AraC family transcriptional regulator [Acinetobacter stercoris]|uniref:HTH-type transcriptional activator RhaR n=1 Tax=Acinetobacter stercoris TaxID=2126983 RepID=A0A2U3N1H4_9GAMM|nr:AraC family transcriptional regulator [Acinetobacter stercoris]SPL71530.1 HTH-type transcriptional activator RhaR [Acinetobacter stercoris]
MELGKLIELDEFFYNKDDIVTPHSNLWGDFNFSLNGTLELNISGQQFLSPPSYGLWIPPQIEHCCTAFEEQLTHYICIRIHPCLSKQLSNEAKTLSVSAFLKHTVEEILQQKNSGIPSASYYEHLLQILIDQIYISPVYDHYLPQSNHPILKPILSALSEPTHFHKSLQQILETFDITERHILRLSQKELLMSISEWRNRAKLIYAITQLQQGISIKKISYELGYQHSSSFIEFFKRYTGQTPSQIKYA